MNKQQKFFEKKEYKQFNKKWHKHFVLAGDIGGTNTALGIFGIRNNLPRLLLSFHFKSNKLDGLHTAINETLIYVQKHYNIKITKSCFGVAGVLSPKKDYSKITNVGWDVSKTALLKRTKLKNITLLNDFEAIGYGINMISKNDVMTIKKAEKIEKAPILVIGAGTGLGKTLLIYNEHYKYYVTIPSEAGHSDFSAQSKYELDLVNFIKKHKKMQNVSYEQVVSGQGLNNIYLFLRKIKKYPSTKYTKEVDKAKDKPELISKYRKYDKTCKEVFKIFKLFYARFAKNFALDSLPLGGVYIAGGISPKNEDIFDSKFVREFEKNHKMHHVLKKIPIYLITNTNVGLLGAGFVASRI